MADIRIKDLTTTASTTAADDFFAADGATNGTRKLSAYSPSFGGNATVGGTLTVNGASIATAGQISSTATSALLAAQVNIANGASSGTNGALSGSQFFAQPGYSLFVGTTGNGTAASYQGGVLSGVVQDQQNYIIGDGARGLLLHAVNGVLRFATGNTGVQRGYFDASGLKVETTTASTSTSTGALVVSGGVGVAGAINAGGAVNAQGILSTSNAAGVAVVGGRQWSIRANASGGSPPSAFVIRDDSLGSERVTIDASGNTSFGGTLAVSGSGDSTLTGPLSWGTTVPVNALLLYKTGNTKYGNGLTSGSWNNFVPAGANKHSWGYMSTSDGTSYTELATLTANTGVMAVLGTTASTSTSSGALVVSGGVGVAGAINAGGNIEATGGADFTSVAASFARIHTVSSAPRLTLVRSGSTSNRRAFDIINNADGLISMRFINDDLSGSTLAATISYTGDFRITGTLQVGNTYASGAPTATGYIVIKDSTGTSYKIPAVAL